MAQGSGLSRRSQAIVVMLLLLILTAFGLRLAYASRISLYIDEFTSIWAAKLILQRGLPLTPAGVIYHRGILFSYVEAMAGALFGFSEMASRMASVFGASLTVACLYLVGKRMLSETTGLLGAAFLTFAPQAVAWGGRARMYSLLQLLSLLAVYFLYGAALQRKRPLYEYLFVLCFVGAVFAQEQAVLLYPALVVAVLALGQWRWFLRQRAVFVNVICWFTIVVRYLLDQVGRPTQLELVHGPAASSGPVAGLLDGLRAYLSFFLQPDQILLTVLCMLALLCAAVTIARDRGTPLPGKTPRPASVAFLGVVLLVTVLEMLVVGGERWSDARYFFMVLPFLMLIAASGLERIMVPVQERLGKSAPGGLTGVLLSPVLFSLVGLVGLGYVPGIHALLSRQIEGHDRAMRYVVERWREGDAIIMASPPVCAVYLDHCDYYAMQKGYEGYVVDRGGKPVDVWVGSPLLNSVSELQDVLRQNDRVWFVVDGWRLATRYELDFLQVVAQQMHLLEEIQGVKILLADGYEPLPAPGVQRSLEANLESKVTLVGYDLNADFVRPGEELCLTLYWRAAASMDDEYTVFVHLVSRDGSLVGQSDSPPMSGLYPTVYWQEGQTVADRHCLEVASGLPEDRYLLQAGMYEPGSRQRLGVVEASGGPVAASIVLDYVRVAERQGAVPQPQQQVGANLGGQLRLLGYDVSQGVVARGEGGMVVEPGGVIPVTLQWQALVAMDRDYTVFLHIVDQQGRIWGQADGQPDSGFYPTSFWEMGEVVLDKHEVPMDVSSAAGDYELLAGVHIWDTGQRLPLLDEEGQPQGDTVSLGVVRVVDR